MQKQDKVFFIHSGSGIGMGGIERVNYEILCGWNEVSKLEPVPFQPKKNISSIIMYLCRIRDKSINSTIFMHLGLTKFLLFGQPAGSIKVFLHGIEAWKKIPCWHKYLLRRVDHFVSNSQFTWDRFLQFNPEFAHVRHDVVHLGIGEPTEYQDPDPNVPAALIIGRMSKGEDYKGHRELIAVWPEIRKAVSNAELWIAGTGDLKPELEKLANGQESIRFLCKVTETEKQDLLRRCRCFAMPSRNEGFGLVYLEAMRLGRPCLVSDCDAGREVVPTPMAGITVNLNRTDVLIEAIIELLKSYGAKERYLAARELYIAKYSSMSFLSRFFSVFCN